MMFVCFFFKQKTAYEMRISDWSSDVCSSDLARSAGCARRAPRSGPAPGAPIISPSSRNPLREDRLQRKAQAAPREARAHERADAARGGDAVARRDEIGRAHVLTPVTNAHLVCRLLLEKKKKQLTYEIEKPLIANK